MAAKSKAHSPSKPQRRRAATSGKRRRAVRESETSQDRLRAEFAGEILQNARETAAIQMKEAATNMAAKNSTASEERIDIACMAAGQIERICLSFMAQSEPDREDGSDPRPIPALVVYEIAARACDLARAAMSALGDELVPTDELQKVVRSTHGTFVLPTMEVHFHD